MEQMLDTLLRVMTEFVTLKPRRGSLQKQLISVCFLYHVMWAYLIYEEPNSFRPLIITAFNLFYLASMVSAPHFHLKKSQCQYT